MLAKVPNGDGGGEMGGGLARSGISFHNIHSILFDVVCDGMRAAATNLAEP